jgi:tripartite-type tricarboxylate transporter receptor subunit TctC
MALRFAGRLLVLARPWLIAAIGCLPVFSSARADEVADFYRGKQLHVVVGYGPGGGYDVYARIMARHIGRHLPGQPTTIVQNMPGAGSLVAANYLYRIAPKDGSVFGIFARNMPMLGILASNKNVRFDSRKFTWLGSSSSYANDAYLLLIRKDAKIQSIADARLPNAPPLVIGTTAEGTSSDAMPIVLRDLVGFNVKAISGYTDSGQLFLAIERGEIEGRTVGLSAVKSNKPEWLAPNGMMRVLMVFGRDTRHPEYPGTPTVRELAKGKAERQLIEAIEVPYKLSRPFAAPPGVPLERAKALQDAFMKMHSDPLYLEEAEKAGLDVSPIGGAEILALIEKVAALPPEMLKAIEKLIEGG